MRLFRRLKNPIDGVMHVTWCSRPDPLEARGPCTVIFTLEAPGCSPEPGQQIFDVASSQWPRPGQDVPVTFDRDRPSRMTVRWSRADSAYPAEGENGEGRVTTMTDASARREPSPDVAAQVFGAAFARGTGLSDVLVDGVPEGLVRVRRLRPTDLPSQLGRLVALRDRGLITRAEFDRLCADLPAAGDCCA